MRLTPSFVQCILRNFLLLSSGTVVGKTGPQLLVHLVCSRKGVWKRDVELMDIRHKNVMFQPSSFQGISILLLNLPRRFYLYSLWKFCQNVINNLHAYTFENSTLIAKNKIQWHWEVGFKPQPSYYMSTVLPSKLDWERELHCSIFIYLYND